MTSTCKYYSNTGYVGNRAKKRRLSNLTNGEQFYDIVSFAEQESVIEGRYVRTHMVLNTKYGTVQLQAPEAADNSTHAIDWHNNARERDR